MSGQHLRQTRVRRSELDDTESKVSITQLTVPARHLVTAAAFVILCGVYAEVRFGGLLSDLIAKVAALQIAVAAEAKVDTRQWDRINKLEEIARQ